MNFREYLQNLINSKQARAAELRNLITAATTADEVRSLGNELTNVENEIRDAQTQLAGVEAQEAEEARAAALAQAQPQFNPTAAVASTNMNQNTQERSNENPRATMEYRTAFMNFVQRGEVNRDVLQFEQRNGTGTSSDLGVLLPETIVQSIMTEIEKVYGQLYTKVRKTNIPGAVKYPIGSFSASFNRITETTVSNRQHTGDVTGYIQFSYNIGEIRIARTLLQTVLTVAAFEAEFAKVVVRAYVVAMDKEIIKGDPANNECCGILTNHADGIQRIAADHIIEFSANDMKDWKKWQENLFAKIPLAMRGLRPEFVMTANTYEANIKTLADNNNRPVYNETFNPVDGTETASFKGRTVQFVEEDILKNFNDASAGDVFGLYWVPEQAYCINSNMQFSVVEYFDHETNQYVKKALVINDGKILDAQYIYLLKKKA